METKMTEEEQIYLLIQYVNSAADLAEQLTRDLKKGSKISMATTTRLVKFVKASEDAAKLLKKFKREEMKYDN